MSVYLGYTPREKQEVAESVSARGIRLIRAIPSQIKTMVHLRRVQPGFATYTTFLVAYIAAMLTGTPVDMMTFGFVLVMTLAESFPFDYPSLCVSPKTFATEIVERLTSLGGAEVHISGKRCWIFHNPTRDTVKLLASMDLNRECPTAMNTVNLSALDPLRFIVRLFSAFYLTHSYSAYSDPDHMNALDSLQPSFAEKRSRKRKSRGKGKGPVKAKKVTNKTSPTDARMEGEEEEEDYESEEDVFDPEKDIMVTWRTPIPQRASMGWGTAQDVPGQYGIYFPFVADLADIDPHTVLRVCKRWFPGFFGQTHEQALQTFQSLSSGFGNIARTLIGHQLAHMAFTIDLALRTQTRAFPVFANDVYMGTVLLGCGYWMTVAGRSYLPVAPTELRAEIGKAGGHASVLHSIAKILGWPILVGKEEKPIEQVIVTMRHLSFMLIDTPATEDKRRTVIALAKSLSFKEHYYGINPESIMKILRELAKPKTSFKDIDRTIPLHPDFLFTQSYEESLLSAFGYMAPNFMPNGGVKVKLTDTEIQTIDKEKGKKKIPWTTFTVRLSTVEGAAQALKEVKENGKVLVLMNSRRSGPHADRVYRGDEWAGIKAALTLYAGTPEETSNKVVVETKETAVVAGFGGDEY